MSVENEDLDFSAFFEKAANGEEPPQATETGVEEAKPAEEAAPAEPPEPAAPAEPAPAEPAAGAGSAGAGSAPAAPVDLDKLVKDTVAATVAAQKPAEPAPAAPAPTFIPEEIQTEIATLREALKVDWPEHVGVVDLMEKALGAQAKMFTETVNQLKAQIVPIQQTTQAQAEAAYEAAILGAHPDAFELAPDIEKWISEKPAYLQPAYKAVFEGATGTAADVIGMVAEYKKEKGIAKPAPAAAPAVDPEKLQKAQSTAPVAALAAATPGVVDPNDFDGAFRAAAAAAAAR